ncbi:hypothetical protein [Pseudomonas sp. BNK-30]|uniref:hypothetical protein n=1 Tax=Pseudomonas sp. BNK-30 TaxID=3376165 RepID=UPI0039BFA26E
MQESKDYILLYLENESSKLRAELLKENYDLRLQLEKIKSETLEVLSDVNGKISNAEDKITEKAIDKTLGIISQVKNWLAIAALVISAIFGLGVILGYNNLSNTLIALFNDKVNRWMRFEDEQSGGRQALDELRTEAIINAYMIRLARNYASVSESLFPLNGPEEKRLLSVLLAPESKYSNFSDALTIIIKNRGPFRPALSEDDVGRKIASLLTMPAISSDKKWLVLEKLKGDGALLPYSRSILNDDDQNIFTRMVAWENVKFFDKEMALDFAVKNVGTIKPDLKSDLLLFLAKESAQYDLALGYVRDLISQKPEYWESGVLKVVSGLGETLPPTLNPNAEKLSDFFVEVVSLGGRVGISDERFGPKRIALQLDGASSVLVKPGRLLKSSDLVKAVVTKNDSVDWVKKSTDFFQVSDQGVLLSTLTVAFGGKSGIEMQNGSRLSSDNVIDSVWLRVQNFPGGNALVATWRDKNTGVVHQDPVREFNDIKDMNFRLSFDEKLLESLSYEYHSPTDRL